MSWRLARSLKQLQSELDTRFPTRTKPDWTIGDAAHKQRRSDHNPNGQGVVTAIDVRGKAVAGWLFDWIVANKPARVKYAIHNSKIVNSTVEPWKVRDFGGHPHSDHIHVSVGRGTSGSSTRPDLYDDSSSWGLAETTSQEGGFTMFAPCKYNERDSDAVRMVQTYLRYTLGLDIGTFGHNQDGVDGHYGNRTATGLAKALGQSNEVRTFNHRVFADLLRVRHSPDPKQLTEARANQLFVTRGTTVKLP